MKQFNLFSFGFLISRHRTKRLAIAACERRIKRGRKLVTEGKASTTGFEYAIRRGKRCVYGAMGYL